MSETITSGVKMGDLIPRAVDGAIHFVPPDDKIVGVVCVVYVLDTGKVLVSRERMNKPWCDKRVGDFSPPAGGRERDESIQGALVRELWQETGLPIDSLMLDPIPLGYFQFPGGEWIVARTVVTTSTRLRGYVVSPQDGETDCPLLWSGDETGLPLRGGMEGILKTLFAGKRMVVEQTSKGRHNNDNGVFDPTALVVDSCGKEKHFGWNALVVNEGGELA